MKHLKKYEVYYDDGVLVYNVGDYVYIDINRIKMNNKKYQYIDSLPNSPLGQVMEYVPGFDYCYEVKINPTGRNEDLSRDEIMRLMTPEEIEEYKIKMTANKFNL